MHPVLFNIGKLPIHSYGFMLMLSFLFAIWIAGVRCKRRGLNPDVISDWGFWVILSAVVGARLYYVVLHYEEFKGNLLGIINPFHGGSMGIGGLVMYGGFIGAILASILYFRIRKLPFLPYADAAAPTVGLGIFLTRIGCFLNGCCFGAPANGVCAVSFPPDSPAGYYQSLEHAHGLYPSQLFESAGGLVIFALIMVIGRKKFSSGFEFYLLGLCYSVLRFCIDFTRFYTPHEHILGLSHNQVVCIAIFAIFGGLMLKGFLGEEKPAVPEQKE
jgi:phosphatidylglycerol---prolipoprotein diacylglyceryl transferase